MRPLDVFSHRRTPELRFTVMQVVRQNNVTAARGLLGDGTRTAIPTATLLKDWVEVRQ